MYNILINTTLPLIGRQYKSNHDRYRGDEGQNGIGREHLFVWLRGDHDSRQVLRQYPDCNHEFEYLQTRVIIHSK